MPSDGSESRANSHRRPPIAGGQGPRPTAKRGSQTRGGRAGVFRRRLSVARPWHRTPDHGFPVPRGANERQGRAKGTPRRARTGATSTPCRAMRMRRNRDHECESFSFRRSFSVGFPWRRIVDHVPPVPRGANERQGRATKTPRRRTTGSTDTSCGIVRMRRNRNRE